MTLKNGPRVLLLAAVCLAAACSSAPPVIQSIAAAPTQVAPGGSTTLTVVATDSANNKLTYAWTVPSGWTAANGIVNEPVLFLTAPSGASQAGAATVSISDGQGNSISASVAVSTTAPEAPIISSLTASPPAVAPGGTSTLFVLAKSPTGSALTYAWSSSDASWTISGSGNKATITAPATASASTIATVTVTDATGAKTQDSVTLSTTAAPAVTVDYILSTPSAPQVGTPTTLSALLDTPVASPSYLWTMISKPLNSNATLSSSTAANPTFTPDQYGAYVFEVVVTSGLGAIGANIGEIDVSTDTPVVGVTGGTTISAVVDTPVQIKATASTTDGSPLLYSWSVVSAPAGANWNFYTDATGTADGSASLAPYFAGYTAGTYSLVLTVFDVLSGEGVNIAVTVNVQNYGSIVQVGTVPAIAAGGQASQPMVLKVLAADGVTPVAGTYVNILVADGLYTTSSLVTDLNGEITLQLQGGRVAGTGLVQAWLYPQITASFPFTVVAGTPESVELSASPGTADAPAVLSLSVVDAYGNPVTDNAAANTTQITLSVYSNSGQAGLTGVGQSNPGSNLTVTLTGGVATANVVDTVAEQVSISTGTTVLPVSVLQQYDLGPSGPNANQWDYYSWNYPPKWQVDTGAGQVNTGDTSSFGIQLTPAQYSAYGGSDLSFNISSLAGSSAMATVTFASEASIPTAYDPNDGCAAQASIYATMRNSPNNGNEFSYYTNNDNDWEPVVPFSGYPVLNSCSADYSFATTTAAQGSGPQPFGVQRTPAGWPTVSYDVTDAYQQGYPFFSFSFENNADSYNPPLAASWYVDDITLTTLSYPQTENGITIMIAPGAAHDVGLTAQVTGFAYDCQSTVSGQVVAIAQVEDDHGNVVTAGTPTIGIDWTDSNLTSPNVLTGISNGQVGSGPHGGSEIQIQLVNGQGLVVFQDSTTETGVSISLNPLVTGLTVTGSPSTFDVGPVAATCHYNGIGYDWSDASPQNTTNALEALFACWRYYGEGNCSVNGSLAYYSYSYPGCDGYYTWFYTTPPNQDVCQRGLSSSPSSVYYSFWLNSQEVSEYGCSCYQGTVGDMSDFYSDYYEGSWY